MKRRDEKMMSSDENLTLIKGSRYRIESMQTKDKPLISHGVFKGYATIGPEDAICMQLDDSHKEMAGRIRFIPCHMIISVDVIHIVEEEKKPEKPYTMYG